jgi:hypothetical protein
VEASQARAAGVAACFSAIGIALNRDRARHHYLRAVAAAVVDGSMSATDLQT